jgi:hypothetical protein
MCLQAQTADQHAVTLRGMQNDLQSNIVFHSRMAVEAAAQLEELAERLGTMNQSSEMLEWLEQLRESLAELVALGDP